MAVTALNTTTLSEALAADTIEFTVGSTASILAGYLLVVRGEAMNVLSVPVSGRVQVQRGWTGTSAYQQPSGAIVYIGTPEQFAAIANSSPAATTQTALVGSPGTYPTYLLPGNRAKDGAGNEYVLVDLTFHAYSGVAVLISRVGDFTAIGLVAGAAGSVGIIVEEATSDQYTWALIYGRYAAAQFTSGSSLMTSTGIVALATSTAAPVGALLGLTTSQASSNEDVRIYGLFPTSAITTATTAATSSSGLTASVWANYPFCQRPATT